MADRDGLRSREELLKLVYDETRRFLKKGNRRVDYVELIVEGPTPRRNKINDPRRMTHGTTKYSFDIKAPVNRLHRIIASVDVYVSSQTAVVDARPDQAVSFGEDRAFALQYYLQKKILGI